MPASAAARGCFASSFPGCRRRSPAAFPLIPVFREEYAQMLYEHDDDRDVTELVAHLLGETVALIRQRGFHMVDPQCHEDEPDVVDMAELTGGLDWDRDVEPRLTRGNRSDRAA